MVEPKPHLKDEEQHPLLKMDSGRDGGKATPVTPTVVMPGWTGHSRKNSWREHFPEFVSACWMTLILIGILFLAFFSLGFASIKRQFIIFKYNNTQPGSNVYYHHLIQDNYVPLTFYANYLSDISQNYPFLQFHLVFLNDDTIYDPRRKFLSKLYRSYKKMATNCKELKDFTLNHANVNITVMPLTKFMDNSPLKHKWRSIKKAYLPFYARLFSVWENGGIGLDLSRLSRDFIINSRLNKRATAVLKQHNDGKIGEYADILKKIANEEEKHISAVSLIQQFMGESGMFFNKPHQHILEPLVDSKPLVRTHRNRRNLLEVENNDIIVLNDTVELEAQKNTTTFNSSIDTVINENNFTVFFSPPRNESLLYYSVDNDFNNTAISLPINVTNLANLQSLNTTESNLTVPVNKTDLSFLSEIFLFFELPMAKPFYNELGSEDLDEDNNYGIDESVAIDRTGSIIAASNSFNPFLDHILSNPGYFDVTPGTVIGNIYSTHCSGFFPLRAPFNCNNVFLF